VTVAGVLLTGGTSRRLGRDKATLVLDGRTLAARAADLLTTRGLVAVEVGPGHTALPAVREEPVSGGPLAGLVAGVAALTASLGAPPDAVVLLACDLPRAAPVVDALLAAPPAGLVVPVDAAGRAQHVCARYGAAVVARGAALLATGERSLRALVATVPDDERVEVRDLPPDALADVDTPEDARRWGVEAAR
jgi:molybdopterin-guanine dinucleotide biosynthesis protein A